MQAGKLRHRIVLQEPTSGKDNLGGLKEAWATVATVWAQKAHQSSREFYSAHKINAETTDLFVIRYRLGITPEMRVLYDDKVYDIIGAPDPDGRRREIHLLCKGEVV